MIVFESRLVRRFVGRLERGEEVIATIGQLCEHERIRSAWVRATGILEWAELTEWDGDREAWRAPRRVEGPLTVSAMEGTVAIRNGPPYVELRASMTRHTERGIDALGGTIAAARVYALDFAIEVFEDVRLERDEDLATGLALFKGPSVRGVFARSSSKEPVDPSAAEKPAEKRERAREFQRPRAAQTELPRADAAADDEAASSADGHAPAAPAPGIEQSGGGVSWAQAAAASQIAEKAAAAAPIARRPERAPVVGHVPPPIPTKERDRPREVVPDLLAEPLLQKGDWIDHRQFGLCRVEGEDDDGGIRIKLPSGARKVIKLDYLEVLPPRHEGDRKVFPLRPRKR